MSRRTELVADFAALEPEWRTLWRRSTRATPFDSPEWLLPWWRSFGAGTTPLIATQRSGAGGHELEGLLACYAGDDGVVRCIGAGVSDRLDALLADGSGTDDASRLLARLAAGAAPNISAIDLDGLPADSPLLGALAPRGWTATRHPSATCPALRLPQPASDRVTYYRRRLARAGEVAVEPAEAGALRAALEALIALHGARWGARGEAGMLADERVEQFHRDAAARLCAAGLLRLIVVRVNAMPAAVCYGFNAKGRTFYYLGGFAPEWARYNVGTVAVSHAIEAAERDGAREFDFLRGRERYKYRWGATDRLTWRLRFCRSR
jgi:CelD/BcsL family acetyltransferase involved in cellulose biosynthesis